MKDLVVTQMNLDDVRTNIAIEQTAHREVIDDFHKAYYMSPHTHTFTNWQGVPILKNPLDLWIYQEIVWDLQPTLIIETGTAYGGSALFFASMLDRRQAGRVVTIDLEPHETLPSHPRLTALKGSSTDPKLFAHVKAMAEQCARVMVVLDSDHSKAHVLDELALYASLVTPGQFLIVEDTNICGHPIERDWMGGPGPAEALAEWLPNHPEFQPDVLAERMMMTFYPGGWLRRQA